MSTTAGPAVVDMFHYLARLADDPASRGDFDQSLFKNKICGTSGNGIAVRGEDIGRNVHICRWDDRVTVEMLPLSTYPNGHSPLNTPFRRLRRGQLRNACARKDVVVFHNNWCSGKDKVKRMNSQELWSVDKTTRKCRDLTVVR